jgi:Mg-chelatase subunit ChlD
MDIKELVTLWAQSFQIVDGQYNAVAYVENRNINVGSPSLTYTFKLYDAEGIITERSGTTVLPPDGVYPIFEGRIMTEGRKPTRTEIEFGNDIVWRHGEVGRDQFMVVKRELLNVDSKPRLSADLRNDSLDEAREVEIIATLFDASHNPLTISRAFVDIFPGKSTKNIVFTWPEPITKTLRSCEIPTDVVLGIDLSGSMNDDGGTPPEPISSVLTAARAFVSRLNDEDQIGIVTYATEAKIRDPLTADSIRIEGNIQKLSIGADEERGSTNTGDAIKKMAEELTSSRHNEDARKVAILLTDGLATAPAEDPEMYAENEAKELKAKNIDLFTIGLGEKVNETFLRGVASDEKYYYKAPAIRDLDRIYNSITESICEDGPTVIEIVAKPKTSFR